MNHNKSESMDWSVLLYTSIGVVLVYTNMTTMDVALPSIVRHFGASPLQGNWILLGYMLTNTIMLLAFGRLADLVGRKRLYLLGIAVFTLADLGCGLTNSANVLIALRVVQAIGAAAIVTNTTPLLVEAYPAHKMSLVLGLNLSVTAGSSICGPLLGGALVSWLGWRAIFIAGVPLGILSFCIGNRILHSQETVSTEKFDYPGAVLSFVGLGGLVLALSEGGALGWSDPSIAVALAVGAVATLVFVIVQLRKTHPLIDLSILKNMDLALAYYSNMMMAMVQMATLLLVSLFLQAFFGMDALQAGIHMTGLAAGLMVGTLFSSRLIGKVAPRKVAAVGMILIAVDTCGMSILFRGEPHAVTMSVLLIGIGLGIGLFMTPNTTSIMTSVPVARRGVANGMRAMIQNMGYVVGTAMAMAVVTSPLTEIARHAVYSGQSQLLSTDQLTLFHARYQIVFEILAGLSFSAVLASLLRRSPQTAVTPSQ